MNEPSDPSAGERVSSSSPFRRGFLADFVGMVLVLIFLILFFGFKSEHFLTARTLATVANQIPDLAVIAVGMTFVLIVAGIDLSVGSVLALSGSIVGVALVDWGWPLAPVIILALVVGLMCGLFNGAVAFGLGIPPFIVTLGMLEIARGGAYLATDETTKYIGAKIEMLGAPISVLGLSPAFFIAVAVVVAGQVLLSGTVFGRYAIAIGGNEEAARFSGIRTRPVKVAVFALCGLLSGLAGVFHTSRLSAADPNSGIGLELSAIAAVVIGGTSLMGGRGSVINSFFGVLIIAFLQAGLDSVGASEPTKRVITGVVIIVAVIADACRRWLAGQRFDLVARWFSRPRG